MLQDASIVGMRCSNSRNVTPLPLCQLLMPVSEPNHNIVGDVGLENHAALQAPPEGLLDERILRVFLPCRVQRPRQCAKGDGEERISFFARSNEPRVSTDARHIAVRFGRGDVLPKNLFLMPHVERVRNNIRCASAVQELHCLLLATMQLTVC